MGRDDDRLQSALAVIASSVDDPRIAECEDEWRALAEARGNAFLTPEWARSWFEVYDERPLISVVRRQGGDLLGVMPLAASSGRPRVLKFAGSAMSDLLHPAALREDEGAVAEATGLALDAARERFGLILLENTAVGNDWPARLGHRFPGGLRPYHHRISMAPYLELAGMSFAEFQATRTAKQNAELRRRRRRLADQHDVVFRGTTASRLADDLDALWRLHDLRRDQVAGSGLGSRARDFLGLFARKALERGWLRLSVMELDGKPAAVAYGWLIGGVYGSYQSGWDPRFGRQAVRSLLQEYTLEQMVREGVEVYDLMLGDEGYKMGTASASRSVQTLMLTRTSAARVVAGAEIWLRSYYDRFSAPRRRQINRFFGPVRRLLPSARRR